MSNYIKATNFAVKDTLNTGDTNKIVRGTEIDTEFTAIASAIASKSDSNSPTFTGTPLAPTATTGTNNTQIATTAFVSTAAAAVFPTGGIIMWSGSIAAIPTGWALCDGTNGTPNLRDRFVIGAGSSYAVDATGGSKDAVVVAHTHSVSGTTGSGSAHSHTLGMHTTSVEASSYGLSVGGGFQDRVMVSTATGISSATESSHNHSFSGTTSSAGSSGTNANLPPYYALAYIMKT